MKAKKDQFVGFNLSIHTRIKEQILHHVVNYLVASKALVILNEQDININHDILRDIFHDLIFLNDF